MFVAPLVMQMMCHKRTDGSCHMPQEATQRDAVLPELAQAAQTATHSHPLPPPLVGHSTSWFGYVDYVPATPSARRVHPKSPTLLIKSRGEVSRVEAKKCNWSC